MKDYNIHLKPLQLHGQPGDAVGGRVHRAEVHHGVAADANDLRNNSESTVLASWLGYPVTALVIVFFYSCPGVHNRIQFTFVFLHGNIRSCKL